MSDPKLPSETEAEILRLLIGRGESYGLELVKASDGTLKRGTIYVTLSRMTDKGFVESREETTPPDDYIGIKRRLYKATGLGERALRALEHAQAMMLGKRVLA
jgi:DNA-binding PadR family transcriptional regulator